MENAQKLEMHLTPESVAAQLAERCYRDADFRKRMLADPQGTLEEESKQKLPPGVEVVACQNDDKRWHIPIPTVRENQELQEEDLEKISAGEVAGLALAGVGIAAFLSLGAAVGIAIAAKTGQF